ncbi:uncharacterized protein LOC128930120 [Callithrix jacchus]
MLPSWAPSALCCCFAPRIRAPFFAHAPLSSLTQAPFSAHSALGRWAAGLGGGRAGEQKCLHTSVWGIALATKPLQTYIHKHPTYALTETATNLTPPPTHTDTDIHTDTDTETQSQTPTQTRAHTDSNTARPRAAHNGHQPREPKPGAHADTRSVVYTEGCTRRHTHGPQRHGCSETDTRITGHQKTFKDEERRKSEHRLRKQGNESQT